MTEPLITEPFETWMRDNDVESVYFAPPDNLVPYERFHVRLKGWFLAEHIGRGATIEEAFNDAKSRKDIAA